MRTLAPGSFVTLRSGLRVPVLGLGTRQLKGAECREVGGGREKVGGAGGEIPRPWGMGTLGL